MSSGTSYGGGGLGAILGDMAGVKKHAKHHGGNTDENDSIFSNALSMIQAKEGRLADEDVDEDHMVKAHKSYFGGQGGSGPATSNGMGAAAAMQALKMFNGGTSDNDSGSSQQEFMGMAMGQAAKLFDQQSANGNVSDGASKESAVQQAGEMALKMYMKSEMGGGSSGGLMSMASKFL